MLAAQGYVVLAVNPRGSSGRGEKFSTAIWADWGQKDAQDVLAAVDCAVAQGIADPDRLGVGGWSYGGILTNDVIARTSGSRPRRAGPGSATRSPGYGTDQYVRSTRPSSARRGRTSTAYLEVSYPFLHADRITTPTLFLCGDQDWNVPLLNSEQMYQALKSLGRETQLVVYPGASHSLDKPSYRRDRMERYLAWYGKYLGAGDGAAPDERD